MGAWSAIQWICNIWSHTQAGIEDGDSAELCVGRGGAAAIRRYVVRPASIVRFQIHPTVRIGKLTAWQLP